MTNINKIVSNLFKDPKDDSNITYDELSNSFKSNTSEFIKKNSIYDFFLNENESDNITNKQETFYEEIKFPNYDGLETYGDLIDKSSKQSHLAAILDNQIAYNSKILEVGCGTGQLSLFLKRFNRLIVGTDLSIPSLKLAEDFRSRNEINNVFFTKMNLFNLAFKNEMFDYVISNGVLHHTYNTEKAFSKVLKPLKRNGYIIIGLYHKYGRLYTNIRQKLIKMFGDKFKFLDKRTIDTKISPEKRYAWLNDQYKNPKESSHTLVEVKKWFNKYNIEYLTSIPFDKINKDTKIFEKHNLEYPFLSIKEISMMFSLSQIKEGGFFVVIGKKK